ncbi:hypothetical protein, partial [Flavobacterium panacis]|uniref:hypothetical protein n=1 Tax=Flavobacterium panacis TaxID=2962567 RepID=UPI00214F3667
KLESSNWNLQTGIFKLESSNWNLQTGIFKLESSNWNLQIKSSNRNVSRKTFLNSHSKLSF